MSPQVIQWKQGRFNQYISLPTSYPALFLILYVLAPPPPPSPLLANVYLHYAFDLWVQHWRQHRATGEVIVVRYADDAVLGFQQRADAERFLRDWKERLSRFGLELHPDKTRLIEFGRYAVANRKERGAGKPETFNFLVSLTSVGKLGRPANSSFYARPSASGSLPS